MKIAVVGHIEWGSFVRVDHAPKAGEIVHATESWEEAAGGGSVAAMQLALLNGSCVFFTAVGDDERGHKAIDQLRLNGVEVYASVRSSQATNLAFVHVDTQGERTITVSGDLKPDTSSGVLPWDRLSEMDAVYFISGDVPAIRLARKARKLVSTARTLPVIRDSEVRLDALLRSSDDNEETYKANELPVVPEMVVVTRGISGGDFGNDSRYHYMAEIVPQAEVADLYGCGDSFAAGLTYALAHGVKPEAAVKFASHIGATAARRRGVFGN